MKKLFLFIVLFVVSIYFSDKSIVSYYESEKKLFLQNNLYTLEKNLTTNNTLFIEQANTTFETLINQNEVKEAFQNRDRKKLYNLLKDKYKYLQSIGYKQFHFHTPQNKSFLRMHKPEIFGDDLSYFRHTVSYVNKTRKSIHGIEVGRTSPAYRNVYPIFHKGDYLGSVELSFSITKLVDIMEASYGNYIHVLINKNSHYDSIFKDDRELYKQSNENDEYIDLIKVNESNIFDGIDFNKKIKELIKENMSLNQKFSLEVENNNKNIVENRNYIASFIPIKDVKNQETIYFTVYEANKDLALIQSNMTYKRTISPVILTLIFVSLFMIMKYDTYIKKSKQQIKDEKEFLDKLFDNVEAVVATVSRDGTMNRVNEYTEKVTGYSQNEIASKPYFWNEKFTPDAKKDDIDSLIDYMAKKGRDVFKDESQWITKDGQKRFFEWSKKVIYENNEPSFLLMVGTDITHRKKLESDLINMNDELTAINENLDETVKERTQELEDTYKELLEYKEQLEIKVKEQLEEIRQKDLKMHQQEKMASLGEMLNNIAHHWRQPLNVIYICASNIKLFNEMGGVDNETYNTEIDSIEESCEFLTKTIETFSNYIDQEKVYKENVIEAEITSAKYVLNSILSSKSIKVIDEIDYEKEHKHYMVENELSQVIVNILTNAEYALSESGIEDKWIKISSSEDEEKFTIMIEDNAGGVPENIIDKIFEPYFTTKFKSQGTGLGLSMSYSIIKDSIKGDLYVKNTENGAKFYIEIFLDN